jgi:hypothetical protein
MKGYKLSEIIGQHFSRFYPEDDVRNGFRQTLLEGACRGGGLARSKGRHKILGTGNDHRCQAFDWEIDWLRESHKGPHRAMRSSSCFEFCRKV